MLVSYQYFVILFFLLICSVWEVFKKGKLPYQKSIFVFFTVVLILYCGFRPLDLDQDIKMYFNYFQKFCSYSFYEIIFKDQHRIKEKGYILANKLFCHIGFRPMILFFAILGIGIKSVIISRKSGYPILCLFLYAVIFLPLREYTQIRDALSSSFIIISLLYFNRKEFYVSILYFLIALSFHFVALIYIPIAIFMVLVKRDLYYILLLLMGCILFFLKPTEWLKAGNYLPEQISKYNQAQGSGSSLILLFVVIVLFLYFYSKKYYDYKSVIDTEFYVKLSFIGVFIGLVTYHHAVLSRLSNLLVFFSILLLSKLIPSLSNSRMKYLFICILIIFYIFGVRNFILIVGQGI